MSRPSGAEALRWTARDLFGLHAVPDNPAPNYRRLSRYDETMGVDGFSTMLGDFTKQPEREDALIAAWSQGRVKYWRW